MFGLIILIVTYCGAALSLQLMQPFNEIDTQASYPKAFGSIPWMKTVVSIGPIISLTASLYISSYSIGRMMYSMSKDGLIFNYLSRIHPKTKIPHLAAITALILTVILTLLLDVNNLIGFANIAGFLIYSLIAVGLLVVRYFHNDEEVIVIKFEKEERAYSSSSVLILNQPDKTNKTIVNKAQDYFAQYEFFESKFNALNIIICVFYSNILFFGIYNYIPSFSTAFLVISIVSNLMLTIVLSLFKQRDTQADMSFRVRLFSRLQVK